MTDKKFYTGKELAEARQNALGTSSPSGAYWKLVRLRAQGGGPPFVKAGGATSPVVYDISDFDAWIESNKVRSVAEWRQRVIDQK